MLGTASCDAAIAPEICRRYRDVIVACLDCMRAAGQAVKSAFCTGVRLMSFQD